MAKKRITNEMLDKKLDKLIQKIDNMSLIGWFALGFAIFVSGVVLPKFNTFMLQITIFAAIFGIVIMGIIFVLSIKRYIETR